MKIYLEIGNWEQLGTFVKMLKSIAVFNRIDYKNYKNLNPRL